MQGAEFSEVAKILMALGGSYGEGRNRSAVSRFYYAAFVEARDHLTDRRGFAFKKREAHQEVLRSYEWADHRDAKVIGKNLVQLKKLREAADYDTRSAVDPVAAAEAGHLYKAILALFSTLDFSTCRDPNLDRGGR